MSTLFPLRPNYPSGFKYITDFISKKEEDELTTIISTLELHTFKFQGYEAKRKVASYGYDWNLDTRIFSEGKTIPSDFNPILERQGLNEKSRISAALWEILGSNQ